MKPLLSSGCAAVVGLGLFLSSGTARATISVTANDSFSGVTVNASSGTVSFGGGLAPLAYGQAGANGQFSSSSPASASATDVPVPGGSAAGSGNSSVSGGGSSSASGFIPGTIAGFDTSEGQASLSGMFEITGATGPVNVTFSAQVDSSLDLFSDSYGLFGRGENVFSLSVNGTPTLFADDLLTIGPNETKNDTMSELLSNTMTLMADTPYYIYVQADSEADVVNSSTSVPDSISGPAMTGCLAMSVMLLFSLKRHSLVRAGLFGVTLAGWISTANAMFIGSDPPDVCLACRVQPTRQPNGGVSTSWTEGNLQDNYPATTVTSGYGPTLPFALTYNSYNADGSKAQLDTGVGFGWSHTYNTLLFQQRGQMFRLGADGRVTQYFMNFSGPAGSYTSDAGYFETMTMQPDGSFIVTNKNQSWWHFGTVPGTPFLVQGPVYRLLQMGDRNQNTTTMSYNASGLLTMATDPFGRTLQFTYNASNKLSSVTDPLGRTTTFQYDPEYRVPTQITDPSGNTIRYTYNAQYQMTRKVDRDGRMYFYTYKDRLPYMVTDGSGQPYFSMTNPTNWSVNSTNLAFSLHRSYIPGTTTSTDGNGNVWKYTYDTNGYITTTTAPDATTTLYQYDPVTRFVSAITDPNGNVTHYQYDASGNRTNITDAMGNVTTYTYEPVFNQMTSMTDPNGRTTTYTYDTHGNQIRETDPLGYSKLWSYDTHGNIITSTDKNGNTTSNQYDVYGNLSVTTDPLGDVTTYQYDTDGNRISVTDALGRTTTYTYDALNRMTGMTNALGGVSSTVYDGFGRQISMTDPNTNVTTYSYDVRGRAITTTNAIGGVSSNSYDANDNRISLTDPLGHVTTYQYDSRNRVVSSTNNIGGVSRFTYDAFGNRLSATDPNTNTTTFGYDALNRIIATTNALGGVTTYDYAAPGGPSCCSPSVGSPLITEKVDPDGNATFYHYDELDRRFQTEVKNSDTNETINPGDAVTTMVYDPVGNVLTSTDPSTNTTTYTYDALNRQIDMVNAAGDTTLTHYDAVGNVARVTAPNGNTATNVYDSLNRVIGHYDEIGSFGTAAYDADGNLLSIIDSLGHTTSYTYDGLNRRTSMTDALGQTNTTAYDADGNTVSTMDRNGHTTTYIYDGLNRRTSVTDALGNTTATAYDADGNRLSITDANGHATTCTYDALNRRVSETYPDATPNTRTKTYDAAGNIITRTDQEGQVTTYSYNHLYYLTNRTYSSSGSADSYIYDPGGRMLEATRNGWTDSFGYDGANRLTNTTQNGRMFTYTYDIPGRVQTNTEPSGRLLIYNYDARNRMTTLQDGTPNPPIVTYTYDAMDRVITRTYRNNTTAAYDYNADNWPTSITHSNASSLIAGFSYAYDNEGNKLYEQKLDSPANSGAYGYDAANRLTNFDTGTLSGMTIPSPNVAKSWALDPLGNWNTVVSNSVPDVRTYGPANELLTDNGSNYLYGADGNLTQDSSFKYAYDEENRLTQVQRLSDLAIVGQYQYDALSRRVTESTNPAGAPGTNLFYYDNTRLMEIWDGGGSQTSAFTYGNYIDEEVSMDRGGHTYYYHQNGLWTSYAMTDASGNAAERYSYDVYGAVTVLDAGYNPLPLNSWGTPHSAVGNPWMFTGRQLDEEDGLYYYRARYYDALKGRFLQRDPVEYVSSLNLYEYVRSAPTFYDDPSGMICKGGTWSRTPWGKGINNNKTKLALGFVSAQFSFTPEFSISKCTAECCAESKNPGKEMTDYSGTAAIAWDASISAATWGGTIALGPIDVTAWLGIKGTIGAAGKFSISLGSDYCNNKTLQGSGCFSIGPYGELAVGGEASAEIKWWNYTVGLTGSVRIGLTWQVCVNCNSDGCSPTSFKFMGGTADFQVKGCLPYWGCVGGGFSVGFWQ